jgi:hypothetical protein
VVNAIDGLHDDRPPDPDNVELGSVPEAELLTSAAAFRRSRQRMQDEEIERLDRAVALEQWLLPLLPVAGLDAEHVKLLAGALRSSQ